MLTQSPAANNKLEEGAAVELDISKGPKPRTVPDLTGLTVAQATIRLHDADLALGKTVPQYQANHLRNR